MTIRYVEIPVLLLAATLLSNVAFGQVPAGPPPVYTGNLGGGFAITGGNSETSNFNLTGAIVRDPRTKNVVKATAAYLRGDQNDVLSLDRTAVNVRDEYTVSGRTFVFGQLDYLRDRFKQIIFLWAPGGGVGYKFVNTDTTQFILDGGGGGVIEKNPGVDSSTSGSIIAGQQFRHRISTTATFTQSLASIWKTKDFDDSLTNFSAGVTTTLVGNLELKVEFNDSYKNRPAKPGLRKNDTAFVTAFVLKF